MIIKATAKLDPDDICDKFQKVFGKFDGEVERQEGALPIKEECLYTRFGNRSGCGGRGTDGGAAGYSGVTGGYREGRGSFQSSGHREYQQDQDQSQGSYRGGLQSNRGRSDQQYNRNSVRPDGNIKP